jgi:hypothetical protein
MFTQVAGETVRSKSTFETFADWIRTREKWNRAASALGTTNVQ